MKTLTYALLALAPLLLPACAVQQGGGGGLMSTPVAGGRSGSGSFSYVPTAPARAQLPGSLPRLLLAKVSDESGGGEFRGPTGYSLNVRWPEVVADALTTELQRVNWPVTRSKDLAGASLKASVTKVYAQWNAGFMVRVNGEMRIALTLRDANNRDVWEGELIGHGIGTAGGGGVPGNGIKQALSGAFADAIGKLGDVLEEEKPWEQLGKSPAVAQAPVRAAEEPAPAPKVWSDVDEVPAPRSRRKGHAVVIGIERYRTKLPVADFAAGDAATVAKYASAVLGYPEENVAVLKNEAAAKSDFDKYFDKWLPNRVEKDDEVLVYFSGHGSPNATTGDAFLVPYDGDPTYLEETGYPLAKLYAALGKLPTKKITVVLDSCFSGAGGRSVLAKGARPLVALKGVEAGAGITVIAASSAEQISNSYMEKGHGLFTYFFLKGLKEKGADLKAAFAYLKPEVSKVARREYNTDQEPQWREGR